MNWNVFSVANSALADPSIGEETSFDALQTLADLSLMMPETTADTGMCNLCYQFPSASFSFLSLFS